MMRLDHRHYYGNSSSSSWVTGSCESVISGLYAPPMNNFQSVFVCHPLLPTSVPYEGHVRGCVVCD